MDISLAWRIGTQVGEITGLTQAVGGGEAEECRRMGPHFHRMADAVSTVIGVFHTQGNRVGAIGGKYMPGVGRGIEGGKGAVAKIPVPVTGLVDVVSADSEKGGIAVAHGTGSKIRHRRGVHDHGDRIIHHGYTVAYRVGAPDLVLPRHILYAETQRIAGAGKDSPFRQAI